tara:strand:- start:2281 stop:3420 length:1140 start_codon:yes stop_codon:yes gene_type:complete
MKICAISYIFPNPDQPVLGSYILEQLKELSKDNDVHIITIKKPHWNVPIFEKKHGITIHRIITKNNKLLPIKCFIKILKLNKKYNFDLLHAHFTGYLTLFSSFASLIIDRPFFITAYGLSLDINSVSFLKKYVIKLTYMISKRIINISSYTKSLSDKYISNNKNVIITPGISPSRLNVTIDAEEFRMKNNLGDGILLMSVGGVVWRKGHDIVISILPDIVKKYPNLKYIIIGKGSQVQPLKNMVSNLNLKKNVIFWPTWPSNEELANFYNAIDIFILMSRTKGEAVEGFGIVYVEANYLGKPVIGGLGGGTSEAIENGKCGYLLDPNDKLIIKNKLISLIENKDLRLKMGEYGKQFSRKNHIWKIKTDQIQDLYKQFIK